MRKFAISAVYDSNPSAAGATTDITATFNVLEATQTATNNSSRDRCFQSAGELPVFKSQSDTKQVDDEGQEPDFGSSRVGRSYSDSSIPHFADGEEDSSRLSTFMLGLLDNPIPVADSTPSLPNASLSGPQTPQSSAKLKLKSSPARPLTPKPSPLVLSSNDSNTTTTTNGSVLSPNTESSSQLPAPHSPVRPITDFTSLSHRVEKLKQRIATGIPDVENEMSQIATEIEKNKSKELREVGAVMMSLVKEMKRLSIKSEESNTKLPVLEAYLEKKSSSIFRGWEKRWFQLDAKNFVLTYHFSKEDFEKGAIPRGGFSVSRITNILVHRQVKAGHYYFDVVVDVSTRLNPYKSRTYEIRCDSEEDLRFWVETLHYYKAIALNASKSSTVTN
jgi:hypothetical protein